MAATCSPCSCSNSLSHPRTHNASLFIWFNFSFTLYTPDTYLWFLWWIWPGVSLWEGEAARLCCGCPALHTWTGWLAEPCRRQWQILQDKARMSHLRHKKIMFTKCFTYYKSSNNKNRNKKVIQLTEKHSKNKDPSVIPNSQTAVHRDWFQGI